MKLNEKEKARIIANYPMLAPGLPKIKCPICGNEKPALQNDVFMLRSEDDLSMGIRVAVVHCPKCNRIELFALPPQEG